MSEPAEESAASSSAASAASAASSPPPAPPIEEPPPPPPRRRVNARLAAAAAAGAVVVLLLVTAPLWWQTLPGGARDAGEPAKPAAAAPDPAIAATKAQAAQTAQTVQQLTQRVAALEARPPDIKAGTDLAALQQRVAALEARPAPPPPADLALIQQQLGAQKKLAADLDDRITALQKAEAARAASAQNLAPVALALLQIREAIETGRPFGAEYRALRALVRDQQEIATAAAPLAEPAESGVATRAALAERLRALAPQIATAKPPPKESWKSQIVARLRSLVTIRRVDESASQTPAEAAVATAQRDLAGGDLAGAVAALDSLGGANQAAAQPWLQMAKARLAAETALRQTQAALTAALGNTAPAPQGG